jgi:hypothetical protein
LAGVDLALEGGDSAKFAHGLFGYASGYRIRDEVTGKPVFTKFPKSRRALQLVDIYTLPKGDTVAMANSVKSLCRRLLVEPSFLCVDSTGHTRGVSDLLNSIFGRHYPVNNSESPTGIRIVDTDKSLPSEDFDRIASELWFATRAWLEHDCLWLHPDFDREAVIEQLSGRRYHATKINKVEHKKVYKARNQGHSPDDADAATLLVHAVRVAFHAVLTGDVGSLDNSGAGTGRYAVESDPNPGYVDPTNNLDDIDA